jgi:peptidoglycan/xylan/chitin deacetylase (PgdA/CDA1 family)
MSRNGERALHANPTSDAAKRFLKTVATAAGRWWVPQPTGRVVVLCYHSIHPDSPFASATPPAFAAHLDWLAEHCRVISLRDVPQFAATATPADPPAVAITFDDGYLDNYEYVLPLFASRGLTATFFVTAGFVEKDLDVLARFAQLRATGRGAVRPLEWAHVRAMHEAGMEIGAHTYSHPNLGRLGREAVRDELERSKEIIEQRVGCRVRSVAYPFGKPRRHFTAETTSLVEELGYEYACAVLFRAVRASDSRFRIPRFFVSGDGISELQAKITGAWDVIGLWQDKSPLWLARCVSPRDFAE